MFASRWSGRPPRTPTIVSRSAPRRSAARIASSVSDSSLASGATSIGMPSRGAGRAHRRRANRSRRRPGRGAGRAPRRRGTRVGRDDEIDAVGPARPGGVERGPVRDVAGGNDQGAHRHRSSAPRPRRSPRGRSRRAGSRPSRPSSGGLVGPRGPQLGRVARGRSRCRRPGRRRRQPSACRRACRRRRPTPGVRPSPASAARRGAGSGFWARRRRRRRPPRTVRRCRAGGARPDDRSLRPAVTIPSGKPARREPLEGIAGRRGTTRSRSRSSAAHQRALASSSRASGTPSRRTSPANPARNDAIEVPVERQLERAMTSTFAA